MLRSNALSLTIASVDVTDSFGQRLLNPQNGTGLTAALSGVTTNDANIGLRATGAIGLDIMAAVNANGGAIGLESVGQCK